MGGFSPNQAAAPGWSNYKVPKTDSQSYFDSHTFLNGAFLYKYVYTLISLKGIPTWLLTKSFAFRAEHQ